MELIGDIDGSLRRLLTAVQPRGISGRDAGGGTKPARRSSTRTSEPRSSPTSRQVPPATLADHPAARNADLRSSAGRHRRQRRRRPQGLVARLYQAYEPNTVIISNGFAWASLARCDRGEARPPRRKVVALCGDGGFLMNSQELETAKRVGANITVVVWRDDGYGLIDWKQRNEFKASGWSLATGLRRLRRVVRDRRVPPVFGCRSRPTPRALDIEGPSLVEVPIDYRENLRLTERLGAFAGA